MELILDFQSKRLIIKGEDDQKVLEAVGAVRSLISKFEVTIVPSGEAIKEPVPPAPRLIQPSVFGPNMNTTMREFGKALKPHATSLYDRIAVLAYYATRKEGRTSFTPSELTQWFSICTFDMPKKHMSIYLFDAKRKTRYVDSKSRGQWTLAPDGENRVNRLIEAAGIIS